MSSELGSYYLNRLLQSTAVFFFIACLINTLVFASGFAAESFRNKRVQDHVETIRIIEPSVGSDIEGEVNVTFTATGMDWAEAWLWKQPDDLNTEYWGSDFSVMPRKLLSSSIGPLYEFKFNADLYPHGPMTLRIMTEANNGQWDLFELQLFNHGGVKWNQGVPDSVPTGAKGMRLVFQDDYNNMPAISPKGLKAKYSAHKPRFGDFSGWRFSHKDDHAGAYDPFEQKDTWLRIKARKWGDQKHQSGTGLLASARFDGTGIWAQAPCYFEARFIAQSAPGTWPAFWLLNGMDRREASDEIDVIEGYGGVGKGNPNSSVYHATTHYWHQTDQSGRKLKGDGKKIPIMALGGGSFWSTTFHTYGVKITQLKTTYYMDNIEVFSHKTGKLSTERPFFFLLNYAIGGLSGWPVNLDRFGNSSDMWIDYVRVYQGGDIDLSDYRHNNRIENQ